MGREKVSEQTIASHVLNYLAEQGLDLYQEVPLPSSMASVDIVGVFPNNKEVWVVETKTSWSVDLLEQCLERKRYVHRVYAAAPLTKKIPLQLAIELGIGLITVNAHDVRRSVGLPTVRFHLEAPRLSPDARVGRLLRSSLRPEHKTVVAAGSANATGRWTPFRETSKQLRNHVARNPGCLLFEAVRSVQHHYRTANNARASLAARIREGLVPGVKISVEGGRLLLYPSEEFACRSTG